MAATQRPKPRARKASTDVPIISTGKINGVKSEPSPLPPVIFENSRNNDDDDDDDDFWIRRAPRSGAKALSAPTLSIEKPFSPEQHLENEIGFTSAEDEDDEGTIKSSDDEESRKRKKNRTKLPSWTKSNSLSKLEAASKMPSSSRLSIDLLSSTDSESHHIGKRMRREKSKSESPDDLTAPPPVRKEVFEQLSKLLQQHKPIERADIIEEDDDESSHESHAPVMLDPDLVRMMKTDRAREARKVAKEEQARRRAEAERAKREGRNQPLSQHQQQQSSDVIEVEDSEDENRRKLSRRQESSSPVQAVSPPPPRIAPREVQYPQSSQQSVSEEQFQEPTEETERIAVIMKGGDGGQLTALVRVKPTTLVKKLLDHFVEVHKMSIPASKRKSVRLRFDGDWIKPNSAIGDTGIEDEEQMDVVW